MSYAWIDLGDGRSVYRKVQEFKDVRSHLPAPMISTDTMDLTEHVDGRFYDSKSAFRRVTKANGLIEVGNDTARLRPKPKSLPDRQGIRDSLKRAVAKLS